MDGRWCEHTANWNLSAIAVGTSVWLWCIPVFLAFGAMFLRVIGKNTVRINAMTCSRAPLYKFLSLKGYLKYATQLRFRQTLILYLRVE